jgi:hypothetical protein
MSTDLHGRRRSRFRCGEHLHETITRYVKIYNQHIPQRALGHSSPIGKLKQWCRKQPELFRKQPYNQPGLDNQPRLDR